MGDLWCSNRILSTENISFQAKGTNLEQGSKTKTIEMPSSFGDCTQKFKILWGRKPHGFWAHLTCRMISNFLFKTINWKIFIKYLQWIEILTFQIKHYMANTIHSIKHSENGMCGYSGSTLDAECPSVIHTIFHLYNNKHSTPSMKSSSQIMSSKDRVIHSGILWVPFIRRFKGWRTVPVTNQVETANEESRN